ncbi:protein of unknown function [Thauera humireducens]|nr:protein of unknown function [Thauera humireducens]
MTRAGDAVTGAVVENGRVHDIILYVM